MINYDKIMILFEIFIKREKLKKKNHKLTEKNIQLKIICEKKHIYKIMLNFSHISYLIFHVFIYMSYKKELKNCGRELEER